MSSLAQRNGRTAALAALLVVFMVGLAFASVPLYRLFCQATGFAGTTQRGASAPGGVDAIVSVRFDANVVPTLPWDFKPERVRQTVRIGERQIAYFDAKNLSDYAITGQAGFNVTPSEAGIYFHKIQCFCFNEQTLKPGQDVRMPVVFYVDPSILKDPDGRSISEITLSYTFYPVDPTKSRG
jgi:cytochrome c oxidase assembly protein subunit 11